MFINQICTEEIQTAKPAVPVKEVEIDEPNKYEKFLSASKDFKGYM